MAGYHFITVWMVEASCEEVYHILEDVESICNWWPSVYLKVRVKAPGAPGGIGKLVSLYTKGWLPYTLNWSFEVEESNPPVGFSLRAFGDFEGRGIWTFRMLNDTTCEIKYDWNIIVTKPFLKIFTPIFRPIFSMNHRWAMDMGLQSIKLEILRRRNKLKGIVASLTPPPGPTFKWSI